MFYLSIISRKVTVSSEDAGSWCWRCRCIILTSSYYRRDFRATLQDYFSLKISSSFHSFSFHFQPRFQPWSRSQSFFHPFPWRHTSKLCLHSIIATIWTLQFKPIHHEFDGGPSQCIFWCVQSDYLNPQGWWSHTSLCCPWIHDRTSELCCQALHQCWSASWVLSSCPHYSGCFDSRQEPSSTNLYTKRPLTVLRFLAWPLLVLVLHFTIRQHLLGSHRRLFRTLSTSHCHQHCCYSHASLDVDHS